MLTTGVDNIVGTSGNDTINAVLGVTPTTGVADVATLTSFDNIDGGAGTDTLNVYYTGATTTTPAATVKSVENVVFNVDNQLTQDLTAWTGVQSVSVVQGGTAAAQDITVKGATSVSVKGGSTVDITDVSGTAADAGSTVTTVTVDGANGHVTLEGKGITNVTLANLTGAAKNVTVADMDTAHALNLTVNKVAGTRTVTDAEATSVAITATGAASEGITLTAVKATGVTIAADEKLTLADVNLTAAKTIAVTGDSLVTITATTDVTALESVTSVGSTGGVAIGAALGTAVAFTGGAGADSIILGATTKAITTGAGDDTVEISAVSALGTGGSIDAGEGTDTLKFSTYADAVTASNTATFAGTISNFEKLELSGVNVAAGAAIKLANLDNINYVTLSAKNTETTTISGMTSGGTIEFKSDQTAAKDATVVVTNANTGTADVLNVVLSKATALANVELIAADVETINVTSTETATTLLGTVTHALDLTATAATALNVSGNAGVTFGTALAGSTALTSIDASGVTTGLVSLTTGALTAAATIKGGAGDNTIVATAATKAVTYTGSDKVDTITINNAQANVINTGAGNDIVTIGSGAVTVDLGAGDDTLVVASAATETQNITLGAGVDTVDINAVQGSAGAYLSLKDFAVGDKIDVADVINSTIAGATLGSKVTLGAAATFANYIDAIAAGDGSSAANSIDGWFQLGGNTYLVIDNSAAATFQDGADIVVEIVGTVDLTNMIQAAGVYTLA